MTFSPSEIQSNPVNMAPLHISAKTSWTSDAEEHVLTDSHPRSLLFLLSTAAVMRTSTCRAGMSDEQEEEEKKNLIRGE